MGWLTAGCGERPADDVPPLRYFFNPTNNYALGLRAYVFKKYNPVEGSERDEVSHVNRYRNDVARNDPSASPRFKSMYVRWSSDLAHSTK